MQYDKMTQKTQTQTQTQKNLGTLNGPSETKPNPENCKNCSSKCAYDCSQLQYTIQHRTVLIISHLTARQLLRNEVDKIQHNKSSETVYCCHQVWSKISSTGTGNAMDMTRKQVSNTSKYAPPSLSR